MLHVTPNGATCSDRVFMYPAKADLGCLRPRAWESELRYRTIQSQGPARSLRFSYDRLRHQLSRLGQNHGIKLLGPHLRRDPWRHAWGWATGVRDQDIDSRQFTDHVAERAPRIYIEEIADRYLGGTTLLLLYAAGPPVKHSRVSRPRPREHPPRPAAVCRCFSESL